MQQEAAVVLSQGGGFQIYYKQKPDGSIYEWQVPLMGEIAEFCRARQKVCHKAKPVPQIALLYSAEDFKRRVSHVYSTFGGEIVPLRGTLGCLLDGQHVVDVVADHNLLGRCGEYGLIVVPETHFISRKMKRELLGYVQAGGSLLVTGPATVKLFRKELGVARAGKVEEKPGFLEHDGWVAPVTGARQAITLRKGVRSIGALYNDDDTTRKPDIAAGVAKLGKGRIAATFFDFGERYEKAKTAHMRAFLSALVRELFPRPDVEVTGSHNVDVTLMHKDGALRVNLANTNGPHDDGGVLTHDALPPAGPIEIAVRTPRRPKSITRHPGGRTLRFTYGRGVARATLPRLEIHEVVEVS
jgi:hypothetical protein